MTPDDPGFWEGYIEEQEAFNKLPCEEKLKQIEDRHHTELAHRYQVHRNEIDRILKIATLTKEMMFPEIMEHVAADQKTIMHMTHKLVVQRNKIEALEKEVAMLRRELGLVAKS